MINLLAAFGAGTIVVLIIRSIWSAFVYDSESKFMVTNACIDAAFKRIEKLEHSLLKRNRK